MVKDLVNSLPRMSFLQSCRLQLNLVDKEYQMAEYFSMGQASESVCFADLFISLHVKELKF